jgi:hypothetical protein
MQLSIIVLDHELSLSGVCSWLKFKSGRALIELKLLRLRVEKNQKNLLTKYVIHFRIIFFCVFFSFYCSDIFFNPNTSNEVLGLKRISEP